MNALEPAAFLRDNWQKAPLFVRQAVPDGLPRIDQDELAWLATQPDVESRLVFTERGGDRARYRVEHGAFTELELNDLPERDWTLLVNDVEKHLPALRAWIELVDFIPDWRVDDLMISFAAPGGSVGPHRDNYDVFLCQCTGERVWQFTPDPLAADAKASDELALLQPFSANRTLAAAGDVLYLPPGIAHWGVAECASLTYSVGMRAPRLSELASAQPARNADAFYTDPDLSIDEAMPGYISERAVLRAHAQLGGRGDFAATADRLGRLVTTPKDWLAPDGCDTEPDAASILRLHGMARLAYDDERVYLNGRARSASDVERRMVARICADRQLSCADLPGNDAPGRDSALIRWMIFHGAFEILVNNG